MRIGLFCGGPSQERGISLNSARSAMDHLIPFGWKITPFYCDPMGKFYQISPSQLYSNTPSDFDFKLTDMAKPLSETELVNKLKIEIDLVLPIIHGSFGEDGTLQKIFEKHDIPFVGSSSSSCHKMFDKAVAANYMAEHGFPTHPNCCIYEDETPEACLKKASEFFQGTNAEKVVVKPAEGGSSIGVEIATTPDEAVQHASEIFKNNYGGQAFIEPYCNGKEFTVVVLENHENLPVSLIPIEIDKKGAELYTTHAKYFPSNDTAYHCPPLPENGFSDEIVKKIQTDAEKIFLLFKMRDFSRIDGWLLDDGRIIFSDINPIPDLEQTSFLFMEGSRIGLDHGQIMSLIILHAAKRYSLNCDSEPARKKNRAKIIRIILGGETSERQVSLMSGTNVWLKLIHDPKYLPNPYILTDRQEVWELPYSFALDNTTEEILDHCINSDSLISQLNKIVPSIRERLGLSLITEEILSPPRRMSLRQFCQEAADEDAFVFNALHGGMGEDGTIQKIFDEYQLEYNGSGAAASELCMDKLETGRVLNAANDPLLISSPKKCISAKNPENIPNIWNDAIKILDTDDILIKPRSDGCSTGVARLTSDGDLAKYMHAIQEGGILKNGTLTKQTSDIIMPMDVSQLILEPFIETDDVSVEMTADGSKLQHKIRKGWIEMTAGVTEDAGIYHSFTPSITVKELGDVLTVEEKFQGGTGINLTPPDIITQEQVNHIKSKIEKAAGILGIRGYSRIDFFFNCVSNEILVIEANTLPGLTPSTVIYHQALVETPPLSPREFLSMIVKFGINSKKKDGGMIIGQLVSAI